MQSPLRLSHVCDLANARRGQLDDSLAFHQFGRDVEDELSTIQEHLYHVTSKDLGTSYIAVQNLQRRHQVCDVFNLLQSSIEHENSYLKLSSKVCEQVVNNLCWHCLSQVIKNVKQCALTTCNKHDRDVRLVTRFS